MVTGAKNSDSWLIGSKPSDFFFLKGIIKSILNRLGIENIKTSTAKTAIFTEAVIFSSQKKKIVEFGVVNQTTLKYFDIKQEVLFADFNWEILLELSQNQTVKIKNLPKFPSVKRDLALLLDTTVTFDELYQLAFQAERNLLKEVDLFDVYQGKNLPENKKSYAVSFLLQDETKTLTDQQIEKTMSKLLQTFEKELGAALRQ